MARTDYIQPDPIKGFGEDQQQVVRGTANSLRQRMQVNPGVGYKQQATNLGNKIANYGASAGKALLGGVDSVRNTLSSKPNGMRLNNQQGANTQNDLASFGNNIVNAGGHVVDGLESFGRTIASPFEGVGRDLGGYIYDSTHPQNQATVNQNVPVNQQQQVSNDITVGSPESRVAHQAILDKYNIQNTPANTDAAGTNQTANYRDSFITGNNAPDSEGDTLGVSLGGNNSVSGLTPEQAARIQKSLANGNQVSGFNMGNMIASTRSNADGKIMDAMRNGNINTDKASALMNRDFRASDRMDRLGGKAGTYQAPDATPTNIQEAMAYGQDLNNFTRNGELNNKQALLAQQSYLSQLGGFKGLGNAQSGEKTKAEINKINAETKQILSGKSKNKSAFKPAFNDDTIDEMFPGDGLGEVRNNARQINNDSWRKLMAEYSINPSIDNPALDKFSSIFKIPKISIYESLNR